MRLDDIAMAYHEQVDGWALDYFAGVGISKPMVDEFRLGWCYEPMLSQHEALRNTPVFPFWTVRNKVVQLRFDAIRQDMIGSHDKFIAGQDYPFPVPEYHLYNVRHTLPGLRTAQVVLTSDIRSTIIARQAGWRAVAAPGYSRWYDPWVYLFEDAHVVMVWSEDEDIHAEKVTRLFKRQGIEMLPMRLPAGETLASILGPDIPPGQDIVELLGSLTIQERHEDE